MVLLGASLLFQNLWVSEYFPDAFLGSASVEFFSPDIPGSGGPSVLFTVLPLGVYCGGISVPYASVIFLHAGLQDGSQAGEVMLRGFYWGKKQGFRIGISPVLDLSYYFPGGGKRIILHSFGMNLGVGKNIEGYEVGVNSLLSFSPFQILVRGYVLKEFSGFSFALSPGVFYSGVGLLPRFMISVYKMFPIHFSTDVSSFYVGAYGEYFSVPDIGTMISLEYMSLRISYLFKFNWFSGGISHIFELSISKSKLSAL